MVINDFIVLAFLMNDEYLMILCTLHSIKDREVLLEIPLKKCHRISMDVVIVGATLHVLPVVHILSIKLSSGDGTAIFQFTCATFIYSFERPRGGYCLVGSTEVVHVFPGRASLNSCFALKKISIFSVHFFWKRVLYD